MSVRTSVSALVSSAAILVLTAAATAAPIGEAASVVPASSYTRGDNERTLAIRDSLEQNDRIRTTGNGSTQIRFLDDTMLTIGPNSEVLLDQFVFDGNRAQKATVEVVRGAMRFVSGTSDRRAYEIKTPVATIGVRGTVVDIGVVNGRWSFNTVDGEITATLLNGERRTFTAGGPGFAIGPAGFLPLNPNDASMLWRRLDGAHLALAKISGKDPSAPQGAAAGNQGGNTGNTGQGGRGQNGGGNGDGNRGGDSGEKNGGGPGSGSTGGPAYSNPPAITVISAIQALGQISNNILGPTGPGPAFPSSFSVLSITGHGGGEIPGPPIGDDLNRLFINRSTAVWDAGVNGAIRAGVLSGTNPTSLDPDPVALARISATVSDLHTDTTNGAEPLYQIGRWNNGALVYAFQGGSGVVNLSANQGLHYLVYGHTGGLYKDAQQRFDYGRQVTFNLESATSPTWSNGQSAPGNFTGSLAVILGTQALQYGLTGTITMSEGSINLSTPGGTSDPSLSGAIGDVRGGTKVVFGFLQSGNIVNTGGTLCTGSCMGEIEFVNITKDKVGIVYTITNGLNFDTDPQIDGAAVFASTTNVTPVRPVAAFADTNGGQQVLFTGRVSGEAQVVGENTQINSLNDANSSLFRTRNSGTVTDSGSVPGIIAWERWTDGVVASENGLLAVPLHGGLHLVHGLPTPSANIPTGAGGGLNVQYSLVGATIPTVADGSVSTAIANPAFVGNGGPGTSKVGIDFTGTTPKLGLDLFVQIGQGFGTSVYKFGTTGGAANPASGGLNITSGAFATSGLTLPVTLLGTPGDGVASCTSAGNCMAGVSGFLAGVEASHIGLGYLFGNTTGTDQSPKVSGAAVFGRDLPLSTMGVFGYADLANTNDNQLLASSLIHFSRIPSGSQTAQDTAIVADNSTVSGLSVQSFDLNVSIPGTVTGWHRLNIGGANGGVSNDQGTIAGVLGWERFTGDLHTHSSNGGGPMINLTSNQGVHILHGVGATNIPTTGTYNYSLVGGTQPTVADGSSAPGTLTSGNVGVNFASAAPKFGVNLNVAVAGGNYNIQSSGGAVGPSLAAPNLANGVFSASNIPTSLTGGTNVVCPSGCSAGVAGILAGDMAKSLGIVYQFGNTSNPSKVVTGAAGFTRP